MLRPRDARLARAAALGLLLTRACSRLVGGAAAHRRGGADAGDAGVARARLVSLAAFRAEAAPSVAHRVVRAAGEHLGDPSPAIAKLCDAQADLPVLLRSPFAPLER